MKYSRSFSLKITCMALSTGCVSLAANSLELQEIVVTAQKREQRLQDVPISINALTEEMLVRANINEITSLPQIAPSLNFKDGFSPVATTFNIRGVSSFSQEGGIQPSVSLVVDGVPLARAGEFVSQLADIERVEILNGPQGTLFGRNATAGVINIVNKGPTEAFEGYLDFTATDDEQMLTRVSLSGPLTDTIRGRLTAFYEDREGYTKNLFPGNSDGGYNLASGAMGKLEIDLTDDLSVLFSADYQESLNGSGVNTIILTEGIVGQHPNGNIGDLRLLALGNGDEAAGQAVIDDLFTVNFSTPQNNNHRSGGVSADLSWQIDEGLLFKSISAYREFSDDNSGDVDSTPASPDNLMNLMIVSVNATTANPGGSDPDRTVDSEYFSQEFRLEFTRDAYDLTVGTYYQQYEEALINEVPLLLVDYFVSPIGATGDQYYISNDPLDSSYEVQTWAAFGDVTFHISETVDVFAGLRWTEEDVELDINNQRQFGFIGDQAAVNAIYDPVRRVLDTSAFPLFPAAADSIFTTDESSSDWSGRLGANWRFREDVMFYASVSRGFIGTAANISRTSTLGTAVLDPSVSTAFEVGMKAEFLNNRLRVNAALFTQEVEDLQTSRLIPGLTSSEAFNAGVIESTGFELNTLFAATDNLTLGLGLSVLDAEFDDLLQPCYTGQTIAQGCNLDSNGNVTVDPALAAQQDITGKNAVYTPELKYNVNANYYLPLEGVGFDFYATLAYVWQDDVQFQITQDPLTIQEDYGLLDITLGIADKQGRYDLSLFGKNVTDEEYVLDAASAVGALGRVFVRVPRGAQAYYGLKLKWNF